MKVNQDSLSLTGSIALQRMLYTKNLTIGYQHKGNNSHVAADLNLNLGKGEIVCLLGPNGVGKSTLIRTLAGIQPPLAGDTYIDAVEVGNISKNVLSKKVALVLTDKINADNLSVYTLLSLGRYPYLNWLGMLSDHDKAVIKKAIHITGVALLLEKNVYELSDGERQKVMIARALVQDTGLIILDEPTAHLDLPSRVEIMHLLRQMVRQTGKSVILSTHELDLALQIADTIWLMVPDEGLIVGTAEDLILEGVFEQAFQKKGLDFCRKTGNFQINVAWHNNKEICLKGSGVRKFWTQRALEREGYRIEKEASARVEVSASAENIWHLRVNSASHDFYNIRSLLLFLKEFY